jgi:5-methylcytosine-specific restriction endonuclease McrA
MKSVLVLNQDYTPLTICSVQRAFLLVFMKKAELLNSVKGLHLRSISKSYPFPSVILIKRYINIPYKGVVLSRHNIFKRDSHKCQYCGTGKELTIDHVIPRSKGGKTSWTNLVTACKKCNTHKGDYSIEKAGLKLQNMPVKPSYISFIRMSHGALREDWNQYLNPKKASA